MSDFPGHKESADSAAALSFGAYLQQVLGRAARTAEAYIRDVSAFHKWCEGNGLETARALGRSQVGLYIMQRSLPGRRDAGPKRVLSSRSAARAVSALKAYRRYLEFSGQLPGAGDVASGDSGLAQTSPSAPKYSRQLPAYFNVDEILALVRAFDEIKGPVALRNSAVLHILYSAGLRVSECAGLRLGSLRSSECLLSVLGKGSKLRTVPYGERASELLERYICQSRPLLAARASSSGAGDLLAAAGLSGTGQDAPLWLSTRGQPLGPRAIQRIVDEAALLAGCLKPVSPHKLRHACATHMLEGGADVRLLQELLGHSSINTTQVYTQITRKQLLESYEKTHPRAKR